MQLNIHNVELMEAMVLQAAIEAAVRWSSADSADVYVAAREPSGWLEYAVTINRAGALPMRLGIIQRTVGAEIECCS